MFKGQSSTLSKPPATVVRKKFPFNRQKPQAVPDSFAATAWKGEDGEEKQGDGDRDTEEREKEKGERERRDLEIVRDRGGER